MADKKPASKKTVKEPKPKTAAELAAQKAAARAVKAIAKTKEKIANISPEGAKISVIKHDPKFTNPEIMEFAKKQSGKVVLETINKFAIFSRKAELIIFKIS